MSPNNKNLIGVIMISIALFLFWAVDVSAFKKVLAYRDGVTERTKQLQDRKQTLDKIKKDNTQIQQKLGDMKRFGSIVPSKKDTAELISAIDRLTQASGVRMTDASVQEDTSATTTYHQMSVSLKLSGSYLAIVSTLNSIEKNIQLMDVQEVSMSPDSQNPNILVGSVKAIAYFLK